MKTLIVILAALMLSGCMTPGGMGNISTLGIDAQKMTAEQIQQAVQLLKAGQEKDASARCLMIPTPLGMARMIEISSNTAGRITGETIMEPDCKTTVKHNSIPAATTPLPVPTPKP